MSVEIVDPCGRVAPDTSAAPDERRAPRAHGERRIAVLDNGKPNARLLLTTLAGGLDPTGPPPLVLDKGAGRNAATAADPAVLARLGDEVDVTLVGSGD